MFGNAIGWLISAVIAALAGVLGYQIVLDSQPTAPTPWVKTVTTLNLDDVAKAALEPMTDMKDDAGQLYRDAAKDYDNHRTEYEQLQATRDFDDETEAVIRQLKGFDMIVQAGQCPTMDLFASKPEEIVGFNTEVAVLSKLQLLSSAMENVINLAKLPDVKRYDVARKFANALAAMGYHLYKERVAYVELSAGEDFLGAGSDSLLSIAKAEHSAGKMAVQQQLQDRRLAEFKDQVMPVFAVISGQGDEDISAHAGDMFLLATTPSTDRVWRVEAIRKLGRLQFNSPKSLADQLKAKKILIQLASDKDPIIRTAAIKARDMTSSDNQSQR
jgi:hypothetical protein